MSISRCSTLSVAFVSCLLLAGSLGCNRQCDKDGKAPVVSIPEKENLVIAEVINIITDVCKLRAEEGTSWCNHTALVPAGVFTEGRANVTLRYSDIELAKDENEFHQNKAGHVTASISFSYKNFTITVQDSESKVIINSTDNQFEITFTLKVPGDGSDESDCFFEWNNIQVQKFESSKTSFGPDDKLRQIIANFQKDELQKALNSKPMMDLLNKEMSVCNKESFLHDITSAFILILALKGFGSIIGSIFTGTFCT